MTYPHIAARLFNTPLLLHPGKLDAIVAGLSGRLGIPVAPSAYVAEPSTPAQGGYLVLENGIAVIEIFGALAHRGGLQADSSYILGYEWIAKQLSAALDDPSVRGILLNIDSPGGEVSGAFQLAADIRAARGQKPIAAVASDLAASAGYLLASAASTVSVSPTSIVGSIGVVSCHVDLSKALSGAGVAVTFLYAGAHKIDGNPYQPLPADVADRFQADIDYLYSAFVDAVATSRPALSAESIRATEARTYIGQQAIDVGLADYLETPDQAIARLSKAIRSPITLSAPKAAQEKKPMSFLSFGKKRLALDISVSDPDTAPDDDPGENPEETAPSAPQELPAEPQEAAAVAKKAPELSASEVMQTCMSEGEPHVATLALQSPQTKESLLAKITRAKAVRAICASVNLPELADGLIAHGATEEAAKLATWDALAARSESTPIDSSPPASRPSMKRAAFEKLTPNAASAFAMSGGVITD